MLVKVSAEAAEEMLEAAAWYDRQKPGLGAEFLDACGTTFETISANPGRNMEVGNGFRRCLMRRFPYIVFFERKDSVLIITAVVHGSRDPKYWRGRLGLD